MAHERIEVKTELDMKLELVKQEVALICVLCNQKGHMGKDCEEVVCILCCARGHLMDQCRDIIIVDEVDGESIADQEETTSVSNKEQPIIRLKNLNDLLNKKNDKFSVSLEETVDLPSEPKSGKIKCQPLDEEESFHKLMIRKFTSFTPPDVISLFKQKYCGLCCTKFSGEKFAWKHYNGRGHESLIKKKTFRNKPLFWQMVFHALISVEPSGATKDEIFDYILETFSAHIGDNPKQVRADMDKTIEDMVGRFHNVVNVNGVYKLRDRNPNDAPKPVPEGLVEKNKYGGGFVKEKKFGFSNFERHLSEQKIRDVVKREVRSKDLVRGEERHRCVGRDSRSKKDGYRRHRRGSQEVGLRSDGGKERDEKDRKRHREHSRSSRRTESRRSSNREDRSRSRSPSFKGGRSDAVKRFNSNQSSLYSPTPPKLVALPPASITQEFPIILDSNSMSYPPPTTNFFTNTSVMAGYSYPSYMTMSAPGIAETLSSLFSGYLMATQEHQALLTPPPTLGEF